MDLAAVRTFVAAVDAGQFQEAAADLEITQQAVSKRIAALERDLGVRLFTRTARGARPTVDGEAFLPHARELPGVVPGTEWAAYYADLAAAFGLTIDTTGPNLGTEPLLDAIADSPALATFVGDRTRLLWPAGHDLRRITVRGPTPVYPHSLIWRRDNPHPALARLGDHLGVAAPSGSGAGTWTPDWARGRPAAS